MGRLLGNQAAGSPQDAEFSRLRGIAGKFVSTRFRKTTRTSAKKQKKIV